jgi:hypothetical protein
MTEQKQLYISHTRIMGCEVVHQSAVHPSLIVLRFLHNPPFSSSFLSFSHRGMIYYSSCFGGAMPRDSGTFAGLIIT